VPIIYTQAYHIQSSEKSKIKKKFFKKSKGRGKKPTLLIREQIYEFYIKPLVRNNKGKKEECNVYF
jgi:hypothetical protein